FDRGPSSWDRRSSRSGKARRRAATRNARARARFLHRSPSRRHPSAHARGAGPAGRFAARSATMRSKPPGYQFDREHERVAAGLALAALAIATPMLARWAGIEDSAPVARQVEFLAVFGLALGLVAA